MKEQNEQQKAKFNEIRKRTQAIRDRYNKQLEKGEVIFEPQTYAHADHGEDDDEDEEQFYYHYATTPPGSMSSVRSFELPVTSFVASKIMSHTHTS
ncbi:hypothetical protein OSTOST_10279 [Ostertagia ostertagi]